MLIQIKRRVHMASIPDQGPNEHCVILHGHNSAGPR